MGACAGAVALASCQNPRPGAAGLVARNDFESLDGWVPAAPTLTTERAHSGRYAVKVDAANEFSLGYANALANTGLRPGQRLVVRGWALRTGPQAGAALVVQLVNPADEKQAVYWQSLPVSKHVITYNRWTPIGQAFTLPAALPAACSCGCTSGGTATPSPLTWTTWS